MDADCLYTEYAKKSESYPPTPPHPWWIASHFRMFHDGSKVYLYAGQ